jgi:hypothetical protein
VKKAKFNLEALFKELDVRMEAINLERRNEGAMTVSRAEVKILGQMSLLANEKVSMLLTLAQTADMDALLIMDSVLKEELKQLLKKYGLVYDEDSYLIWIPNGAAFEALFDFKNVTVKVIDPESAVVSKAVKAPEKNKQLIREAIASGKFKGLVDRIEKNGGNLEFFAED